MKSASKLIFILFSLLVAVPLFSQTENTAKPDDEFNLFLLSLIVIFLCAMIGAAILGAMAAAVSLFFFFALLALGALSSSVAIGLYKKSFSAGFRSFLLILFSIACAILGGVGLFLVDYFFNIPMSGFTNFSIGIVGGLIGGLLMGIATWKVIQWSIKTVIQKLQLT